MEFEIQSEETSIPDELNEETITAEETAVEDKAEEIVSAEQPSLDWGYLQRDSHLLDAGLTIELRGIKTAMVISPNHMIPVVEEGLLIEHRNLPLSAEMDLVLLADDREIVRERFFLPTLQRAEVMAAHRELAKMSTEFLTNSHLRDMAMGVYFPELCEEYDLWYRLEIDELGHLHYSMHMGPSHHQEIKKRIDGKLLL